MARAIITINETLGQLTITLPIEKQLSASGKMELLASTHGNQETDATHDGKAVYANINIGTFVVPKAKSTKA